jgi:UDP-GlcNAc:undecaprenyl-phosphate GlcNAc-1-phosphate transferase
MLVCLALSGALIAFLRYNWPPSTLFMGDAGSLFLGFSAAFFSIVLTQDEGSRVRPIAPLLVLAVPITDTLTVMIKRVIGGKSPFHADKTHLHHILLKFGFSKQQTTSIIVAMTAVFSLLALSGTIFRVPDYFLFGIFLVYFFAYFAFSFMVKKILIRRKAQQRIRTPSMP